MRGTVARIGAESVCLLSGVGLLPRLENFRCLCAAITANPLRPHASPLASPTRQWPIRFLRRTRVAGKGSGGRRPFAIYHIMNDCRRYAADQKAKYDDGDRFRNWPPH